ncbi:MULTISPECIES: hypothetical protein [unclassified Streptomyces]|uniref:hypothetical protein n=1 Tax=unclassified Streptomyces TaxID=2593676 RepID=UPI00226E7A82|nr:MULTISPECIES: hypothetical protein [unclassified Streptomyces]MCY0924482.1 hypothetical protein [Streptomyces sp. H27-G5]MCY0963504.1 hypothetical protein [Streptomyces sp. H27-H5]
MYEHLKRENSERLSAPSAISRAREDELARRLVRKMREKGGQKAYAHMYDAGILWQAKNPGEDLNVKNLSRRNIERLQRSLQPLREEELEFYRTFLAAEFFATHTTSGPVLNEEKNLLNLFSRQKLIERGVKFNIANSPQEDIEWLGNDDYVFFSLEVGKEPKKPSSRFGGRTFRFDFARPEFTDAGWVSLVEMRFAGTPKLQGHIPGLPDEDYGAVSRRELDRFGIVFYGGDMIRGLGLSILERIRGMSDKSQEAMLTMRDDAGLNKLVNGLFRPEIKVPRHFFSENFMQAAVKKDDKGF